jgi:hypothetical protein
MLVRLRRFKTSRGEDGTDVRPDQRWHARSPRANVMQARGNSKPASSVIYLLQHRAATTTPLDSAVPPLLPGFGRRDREKREGQRKAKAGPAGWGVIKGESTHKQRSLFSSLSSTTPPFSLSPSSPTQAPPPPCPSTSHLPRIVSVGTQHEAATSRSARIPAPAS